MGQSPVTEQAFLGSWRLLSFETRRSSGQVDRPFGPNPGGVITYSEGQRLSAMLWRLDRTPFAVEDQQQGSAEEYAAAVRSIVQYVGTFELRADESTIVHRIEQSVFPNLNGVEQVRFYEVSDDEDGLVLTTPPIVYGGEAVVSALTWRRL